MKFSRIVEGSTQTPYTGKSLELYKEIVDDKISSFKCFEIMRSKNPEFLYFETNQGFIYIISLRPHTVEYKKGVAFALDTLKKNGSIESKGYYWGLTMSEFRNKFNSQSVAEKFRDEVFDSIVGLDGRQDITEIIEKIADRY